MRLLLEVDEYVHYETSEVVEYAYRLIHSNSDQPI